MDLDRMQKQTTSLHSDAVSVTSDPEFLAAVLRSHSQEVSSFLSTGPQRFIVLSKHILCLPLEQTTDWTSDEDNNWGLLGIWEYIISHK